MTGSHGVGANRDGVSDPGATAPEQPAIVLVKHCEVLGDPSNVRSALPNVRGLACSIAKYGLLENLVAVEIPEHLRKPGGPWLELRAGSRRFEALRQLIEQGVSEPGACEPGQQGQVYRWPAERAFPVMVLYTNGGWEHLVENIQRADLDPWDIGRRLNEAFSAGMSAREIGKRLGRSNGWITRYIQIGTGLHPDTIAFMRKRRMALQVGQLFALSQLRDSYGDPNAEQQIAELERKLGRRRKRSKRLDPQGLRAYRNRINHIRTQMPVPPLLRPTVTAIIDYLEGQGAPKLRQLSNQLLEQVKNYSPHYDNADLEEERQQ